DSVLDLIVFVIVLREDTPQVFKRWYYRQILISDVEDGWRGWDVGAPLTDYLCFGDVDGQPHPAVHHTHTHTNTHTHTHTQHTHTHTRHPTSDTPTAHTHTTHTPHTHTLISKPSHHTHTLPHTPHTHTHT